MAKLKKKQVARIIKLKGEGVKTSELARAFGVTEGRISQLINKELKEKVADK